MTPSQRKCLDFIQSYQAKNRGVSPSFAEMRKAMGLASTSGIHRLLRALERDGHIRRDKHIARGIVVVDQSPDLSNATTDALWAELAKRGYQHPVAA